MAKTLLRLIAILAVLFCFSRPSRAQQLPLPVRVERGLVTVRAQAGMEALASRVAKSAAPTLAAIEADLPPPKLGRIEIRLVMRASDIARAAPPGRGAPEWAIGVAYPDVGVVVVAFRRGPTVADVDSVVKHELAHMALDASLGPRAPRWLHEGFAYLHSSSFSIDRTRTLTGMAWTGNVIPLHELDRRFPAQELAAHRAYAQSYDFVAFLARRGRLQSRDDDGNRWPFRKFLVLIAEGKSLNEATTQAFTADLDRLFAEWRDSLRDRYLMLPVGMFGILVWIFAAFLLVLAYLRKRRLGRRTMARWEDEEAARYQPPPLVPLAPLPRTHDEGDDGKNESSRLLH